MVVCSAGLPNRSGKRGSKNKATAGCILVHPAATMPRNWPVTVPVQQCPRNDAEGSDTAPQHVALAGQIRRPNGDGHPTCQMQHLCAQRLPAALVTHHWTCKAWRTCQNPPRFAMQPSRSHHQVFQPHWHPWQRQPWPRRGATAYSTSVTQRPYALSHLPDSATARSAAQPLLPSSVLNSLAPIAKATRATLRRSNTAFDQSSIRLPLLPSPNTLMCYNTTLMRSVTPARLSNGAQRRPPALAIEYCKLLHCPARRHNTKILHLPDSAA